MAFTLRRMAVALLVTVALTSTHSFSAPLSITDSALEDAPAEERTTIDHLLGSSAWPRRVIALMRLQRFDCEESAKMIMLGLDDPRAQVRSFATLILAHRRIPQGEKWFVDEQDPCLNLLF